MAESHLQYRAPAHFDELLDVRLTVSQLGTTSLTVDPRFTVEDRMVVTGSVRHVFVDPQTLRKTPIPEHLREPLSALRE